MDTDSVGSTAHGEEPFIGAKQQRRKFTPEFKDEAIKLVSDSGRPVAEVARDIGINEGTLGNWVNVWRSEHAGEEPPLGISERAELAQLRQGHCVLTAASRVSRPFEMALARLLRAALAPARLPQPAGTVTPS